MLIVREERANNVRCPYDSLAKLCVSYGGRKNVLGILATVLQFVWQPYDSLAAAVQNRDSFSYIVQYVL